MCSIGDDDFGDEGGLHAMIPDVELVNGSDSIQASASQLCNKCNKSGAIYKLPFRQAECKQCFLLHVRHKFRAALGSSKVLPKDAQVILVFDGSAESAVLLDMLHHAQTQSAFKRLHCTATVLYIDDFQLLQQNCAVEDYTDFLEKIATTLQKYTYFRSFIVPLVDVKSAIKCLTDIKTIKELQYHLQHGHEKLSLINSINSLKSLTSRQDFLKHHRSKLIASVATHFKSKFAFMPDVSPDLAIDLLAAVALGRGGSAALDVALVDDRLSNGIKLLRPMKDLNRLEIELYVKAQDLQTLQTLRYGWDSSSTASLQNLTKSFVNNLQDNFSTTVSTVFRMGDKMAVNRDMIPCLDELVLNDDYNDIRKVKTSEKHCIFCNSFLDYQNSTTLLATEFSRLVSESGSTLDKCPDLYSKAEENVVSSRDKSYLNQLCHACQNMCMDSPHNNLML